MQDVATIVSNDGTELSAVILPVLITAVVSLITLIVNSFIKIILENKKYNNEQYKIMQNSYAQLKYILISIKLVLDNLQKDALFTNIDEALTNFVEYRQDNTKYRNNHQNQISQIDDFIYLVDYFINRIDQLHTFFLDNPVPSVPVFHPVLEHNINKMLSNLQYFSFVVSQCKSDEISCDLIFKEINNYRLQKNRDFDNSLIESYIEILDKWFKSY